MIIPIIPTSLDIIKSSRSVEIISPSFIHFFLKSEDFAIRYQNKCYLNCQSDHKFTPLPRLALAIYSPIEFMVNDIENNM